MKAAQSYNQRDVKYTGQINTVSESDTCSVCGVTRKPGAAKYCSIACYRMVQRSQSLAARFWPKVRKTATCWLWTGAINPDSGYGQIGISGRYAYTRPVNAHRIAWELTHGSIPEGQWVLHHCDVPACVNPDHLFLGTHRDNMQDAARKHRLSVPRPSRRKLLEPQRVEIRRRYVAGEANMPQLAREYNVTKGYIWQIVHRRSVEFRKAV